MAGKHRSESRGSGASRSQYKYKEPRGEMKGRGFYELVAIFGDYVQIYQRIKADVKKWSWTHQKNLFYDAKIRLETIELFADFLGIPYGINDNKSAFFKLKFENNKYGGLLIDGISFNQNVEARMQNILKSKGVV